MGEYINISISKPRRMIILSLCIVILTQLIISCTYFKRIDHPSILRAGVIFETITLLSLACTFFAVQFVPFLHRHSYLFLNSGLYIWIIANVFDVLDEEYAQPFWLSVFGEDLMRSLGMVLCTVGVFSAVKFANMSFKELRVISKTDPLTELSNRRGFYDALDENINKVFAVLIIDLDNFKSINDNFGHEHGDEILRSFSKILNEFTNANSFSARLGGEEFALCILGGDINEAKKTSQELLNQTRTVMITENSFLTASIGVSMKLKGDMPQDVISIADKALFIAKNSGRDRYCVQY